MAFDPDETWVDITTRHRAHPEVSISMKCPCGRRLTRVPGAFDTRWYCSKHDLMAIDGPPR